MCVCVWVHVCTCACEKTINEATSDAQAVLCLRRAAGWPESWASRGLRLTSTEAQGMPAFFLYDSNLRSAERTLRVQLTDRAVYSSLLLGSQGTFGVTLDEALGR